MLDLILFHRLQIEIAKITRFPNRLTKWLAFYECVWIYFNIYFFYVIKMMEFYS